MNLPEHSEDPMLSAAVLVGTLLAGPRPGCHGDRAALDVMTVNTWGLPSPLTSPSRGWRFPRIRRWLDEARADVVGLQEVWRGADVSPEWIAPGPELGDSGLALHTRLPARPLQVRPFRARRGFDRLKAKAVAHTRVEVPHVGGVAVAITHLQAGASRRAAEVRASQVDELLEELADTTGPVILLGDFNLSHLRAADRASDDRLEAAGFRDAGRASGVLDPTYPDGERYDRVYVRDGAAACLVVVDVAVVEVGRGLSDHHAVRARLSVVRRGER